MPCKRSIAFLEPLSDEDFNASSARSSLASLLFTRLASVAQHLPYAFIALTSHSMARHNTTSLAHPDSWEEVDKPIVAVVDAESAHSLRSVESIKQKGYSGTGSSERVILGYVLDTSRALAGL